VDSPLGPLRLEYALNDKQAGRLVLATEIDMYIGGVDVCSEHFQLVPFASFVFFVVDASF
jgi:hypothetical protein